MLPFRHCCISLSSNCEGKGDERRGEGRRREGGGGKGFVCFHTYELASFSGFFPVGEDLGSNASVIYLALLPPA